MMDERTTLDDAIGARVKNLRQQGGWTLDALATRSGVSRAMISRIERAEASPTATLLARLCGALDVSLSVFFATTDMASPSPLIRRSEQPVWSDPQTGYRRRSVSPPGMPSRIDLVEVEFPAGARVSLPPLGLETGMTQHVWLLDGVLEVTAGETVHALQPGDCLYMSIGAAHGFFNPGDRPARYAVVLDRGLPRKPT